MVKLSFFLLVLVLSLSAVAQDRVTLSADQIKSLVIKSAEKTDKHFNIAEDSARYVALEDSARYSESGDFEKLLYQCELIENDSIRVTAKEALYLYVDGYLHGMVSYQLEKDYDYKQAIRIIRKIKRELKIKNKPSAQWLTR